MLRINARLDDEYALKLDYLQQQTQQSVTDVLKKALDVYYEQIAQTKPYSILAESGFIGCGEASPDLSSSYKVDMTRSLEGKYNSAP